MSVWDDIKQSLGSTPSDYAYDALILTPVGFYTWTAAKVAEGYQKQQIAQEAAAAVAQAGGSPDEQAQAIAEVSSAYDYVQSQPAHDFYPDPYKGVGNSIFPSPTTLGVSAAVVILILALIAFIVFEVK